ncbi:MAG: prepilin-type N-terminal cleavage/methylation domain-containing protein [bacterium]|nr:prepilin-type N-terminal cleavage/methylation domain-containing protein [bacterium]MCX7916984.1 prepilin-type N-terminal cleavage/methylation domain-containing protein [bacterium]MDW8164354.1 prepilin-type N-terminal cleavage/methylation domain-containing protein [Candidatus Omnitrophota bacterium]
MRRRIYGFTLIELLIVIAMIAILVGLTSPILTEAKESKKECMSNLKQIGVTIHIYILDLDDYIPLYARIPFYLYTCYIYGLEG